MSKSRQKITAYIICLNNETTLARALGSLHWVDEILIIDGGSTDRTLEICKKQNEVWSSKIKIVHRAWSGFKDQRNFALQQAAHEWILSIDSDELCSLELADKIQELLSQPSGPTFKYYKVRRQEYFLGKPIYYGCWNPSFQDRFFHKKDVQYVNEIHEYPKYPEEPGRLVEPILHHPDFSPEQFLFKMNKYTGIEALDRYQLGQRTNLWLLCVAFPFMFYRNFFYYKGYKDGVHGFIISLLEGVSRVVRHIKLWQIQNQK